MVHCDHASILHGYKDMGSQRFSSHDFDLENAVITTLGLVGKLGNSFFAGGGFAIIAAHKPRF